MHTPTPLKGSEMHEQLLYNIRIYMFLTKMWPWFHDNGIV